MRALIVVVVVAVARIAAADPYVLPWQLRPAGAANVVRSDTAIATHDAGTTVASTLLGAWRVRPTLAPLIRAAVVHDADAYAMSNVLLGVTSARPIAAPWKLAVLGAITLPVGTDPAVAKAGAMARSSMDNALFAVNDAAAIAGADVAWVKRGFTVQAEATLFQLVRVKGEMDPAKTNLTTGLYVGYTARPWLAGGVELRYQRFLSTPAAVVADPSARDTLTFAVGLRTQLGRARPGIAYARGLDDPMGGRSYQIVQVDLPIAF